MKISSKKVYLGNKLNHVFVAIIIQAAMMLLSLAPVGYAAQNNTKLGPIYLDMPAGMAVVLELPERFEPAASQIQLFVDGQPAAQASRISPFDALQKPLAIVLCADVSGSMKKGPLEEMKRALVALIKNARSLDQFALVAFADETKILSPFTNPQDKLFRSIGLLETTGKWSRIFDALYDSLTLFDDPQLPLRRRVILISDGKNEKSLIDKDTIIKSYKDKGVAIDAVARGKVEKLGANLSTLADNTGGRFEHAIPGMQSVDEAIEKIYAFLLGRQSMVVYFDYTKNQAGHMTSNAHIQIERGGGRFKIELNTPVPKVDTQPKAVEPFEVLTKTESQPEQPYRWLILIIAALIVIFLIFYFLIYRRKYQTTDNEKDKKSAPLEIDNSIESPNLIQPGTEESPTQRDETQIIRYSYPKPAPGRPAAILSGVTGPMSGQRFPIETQEYCIGTSENNDLCIVGDDYVSRRHACLRYQQGSLFIHDQGSRNATFVNQKMVSDTGKVLAIGDQIALGQSVFEIEEAPL